MQAEFRKPGELLGHGDLHVMAGYAFVIGSRLNADQRAVLIVAGIHINNARARSIGRSLAVVGGCGGFLAERLYRLHLHLRFWKQAKKFGKLRLHLRDVMTISFEDLVAGSWRDLWVSWKRCAKTF